MADITNLVPAGKDLAGRDISTLADGKITAPEVDKLRGAGIETVGQLWERIALADGLRGLDELEREAKIEGYRLVELLPAPLAGELADEILYRAELNDIVPLSGKRAAKRKLPRRRRLGQIVARADLWLRAHLLDLLILAGVGLVAFLLFRAFGSFGALPPPWGLSTRYAVAERDLRKGQVLHSQQLHFVLLSPAHEYFPSADGLDGLVLARDVPGQKPLRHKDLLRPQAVAARDVAPGDTLAPSDIKIEWKPFQLTAVLRADDAANRKARLPILKDEVITAEHLAP